MAGTGAPHPFPCFWNAPSDITEVVKQIAECPQTPKHANRDLLQFGFSQSSLLAQVLKGRSEAETTLLLTFTSFSCIVSSDLSIQ